MALIAHDLALALTRYDRLYRAMHPPMSITQFIIMGAIQHGKTHAQANVSQSVGLEQITVRDVIHRLRRKKYLANAGGNCRTGKSLIVTASGVAAYDKTAEIIRRTDIEFFDKILTTTKKFEFTELLQAVTT